MLAVVVLPAAGIMNIGHTTTTEPSDPQPAATKTGYFSMPAAAFNPVQDTVSFSNAGNYVSGDGPLIAPVYLPHEATVTKLTFYWADYNGGHNGRIFLVRYPMSGNNQVMAEAHTSGSSGDGSSYDDTIDNPKIDNALFSYFAVFDITDTLVVCYNVQIEYTYETVISSEEMANSQQTQVSQGSDVPLMER